MVPACCITAKLHAKQHLHRYKLLFLLVNKSASVVVRMTASL